MEITSISVTFDNYKGNKRFSSLYALEIFGSPYAYNNENFYTPGGKHKVLLCWW